MAVEVVGGMADAGETGKAAAFRMKAAKGGLAVGRRDMRTIGAGWRDRVRGKAEFGEERAGFEGGEVGLVADRQGFAVAPGGGVKGIAEVMDSGGMRHGVLLGEENLRVRSAVEEKEPITG